MGTSKKDAGKFPPVPVNLPEEVKNSVPKVRAVVEVSVPMSFNGYVMEDVEHFDIPNLNFDSFQKLVLPYIDTEAPEQRDFVWTRAQQEQLIESLFSPTMRIPTFFLAKKSKRSTDEGRWALDCKQRVTTIRDFLADKFLINVRFKHDDGTVIHKKMCWSEMQKDSGCRAMVNRAKLKPIDVVVYEHCSPESRVKIFGRLGNGTAINDNEKVYCNNYRARLVLNHCYDAILEPIEDILPAKIRSRHRFTHARKVHELMLLCLDANLRGVAGPRSLRQEDRLNSAQIMHNELLTMGFAEEPVTPEVIAHFKLDESIPVMRGLVEILSEIYRQHTDIGRGPKRKGGRTIVPCAFLDPVGFMYKAIQDGRTTLRKLKGKSEEIANALREFEAGKIKHKLNQTTSDGYMIEKKYDLLDDCFVAEELLKKARHAA